MDVYYLRTSIFEFALRMNSGQVKAKGNCLLEQFPTDVTSVWQYFMDASSAIKVGMEFLEHDDTFA